MKPIKSSVSPVRRSPNTARLVIIMVMVVTGLYLLSWEWKKSRGAPLLEDSPDDTFDPFKDEHDGSIEILIPGHSSAKETEGAANEAVRMMRIVTPDPTGTRPILPEDTAKRLSSIEHNRYIRVSGFKYCDMLNNASFDSLAHVYWWGTTVARRDPLVEEFVQLIESEARRLSNVLYDNYPATLNTPLTIKDSGKRRQYKLAFLLMVHGKASNIDNVINLINILDDGSAIILIHVDLNPTTFTNKSTVTFHGYWGHISLVWMQLSGFWELLDLADWDHVINLSAADYPLRYSRDMHSMLSSPAYKGRELVERWEDNNVPSHLTQTLIIAYSNPLTSSRIRHPHDPPHIPRLGQTKDGISLFHPKESGVAYPPFPRWKICKHHQWMVLTPEFVTFLRSSKDALLALAFMEHTWIPDETYFCFVLINTPKFGHKSVNGNKRFLKFNLGSMHPMTLDITSTSLIGQDGLNQEPQHLLIRKIDPRTPSGRQLISWIHREHIEKHATNSTDKLQGEQWVDMEANRKWIKEMLARIDDEALAQAGEALAAGSGGEAPLLPPEAPADFVPAAQAARKVGVPQDSRAKEVEVRPEGKPVAGLV
ncbi:hypothetical protein BC829DRAFT_444809 [Chytridium lagenaria]|nr:hypothetical protein BC829DRAFT_444809 [Chytridium lagenaria]